MGVDNVVKLTDFGLSAKFSPNNPRCFTEPFGTVRYVAPEVLTDDLYGPECDLWSCGVVCYTMLSKTIPFRGATKKVMDTISQGAEWSFHSDRWENISDASKGLVKRLMNA